MELGFQNFRRAHNASHMVIIIRSCALIRTLPVSSLLYRFHTLMTSPRTAFSKYFSSLALQFLIHQLPFTILLIGKIKINLWSENVNAYKGLGFKKMCVLWS